MCDFDPFDLNFDGEVDGIDAFIFNEIINENEDGDDDFLDENDDDDR